MKNNGLYKFLLKRLTAIAIIVVGAHLLVCYFLKVLPFGLAFDPYSDNSISQAIWTVWAFGGLFISGATVFNGIYLLIDSEMDKPERKHRK